MFGNNLFTRNPYSTSKLTFATILNGINRSLNVANQAIPIYQKSKPLFQNANNIFKTIKDFSAKPVFNKDENISEIKKEDISTSTPSTNSPTFFL